MRKSPKTVVSQAVIWILLLMFATFIIVPIMWMITASLTNPIDAFKWPPRLIPHEITLKNFKTVFQKVQVEKFIFNSLEIAFFSTIIHVVSSTMAAYAFARLHFRGSKVLFIVFLSSMMLPGTVLGIPRFIIMSKVHLIDTHLALILPSLFGVFGIFFIRQFMMTIPKSFDEAAKIDGASRGYTLLHIIVPMTKPALVMIAIQDFLGAWNDFEGPLIYINTESRMTLPLGLTVLRGTLGSGNESAVIAGVILTMFVPLVLFIIFQRYMMEGLTLGGLKE